MEAQKCPLRLLFILLFFLPIVAHLPLQPVAQLPEEGLSYCRGVGDVGVDPPGPRLPLPLLQTLYQQPTTTLQNLLIPRRQSPSLDTQPTISPSQSATHTCPAAFSLSTSTISGDESLSLSSALGLVLRLALPFNDR